jgi:hypothetical protein
MEKVTLSYSRIPGQTTIFYGNFYDDEYTADLSDYRHLSCFGFASRETSVPRLHGRAAGFACDQPNEVRGMGHLN